jgi:hypothetical protein
VRAAIILSAILAIRGQDLPTMLAPPVPAPSVLENTGKPMVVPFQCTDEDIHQGGLTCTEEEPCPVFLELTVAGSGGTRILAGGNIHTDAVTLDSVLLASDDGGHTWTEPHERVRAAGLDHIQFYDGEKGWISGEELSPLPQNPFLLVTPDGGKTWTKRPILNESVENRFGTIQVFHFSTKDTGSLIIDRGPGGDNGRYTLYESPDGGDNWLIKQESTKPIAVKMPTPPPADWRIRVDAPTKSFHIEKREGQRWNPVAAFQAKLDSCKPPKPAESGDEKTEVPKPPIKKQ